MHMKWPTLLLFLIATPALAHDSWLSLAESEPESEPESESESEPAAAMLELRLSTGDHFPKPGSASEVGRIEAAEAHFGNRSVPLLPGERLPRWLELKAPIGTAEVALLRLSLKPASIQLTPASAQIYLQELGEPTAWASSLSTTTRATTFRASSSRSSRGDRISGGSKARI
jgi:hypothetical protein